MIIGAQSLITVLNIIIKIEKKILLYIYLNHDTFDFLS